MGLKLRPEDRLVHRAPPRMPLEERLADEARFFKTWIDNPVGTGAVSPSGRALARAMARYVDLDVPGPVIELGPGTGPVTEALIDRGIDRRRLVLVEFEAHFCKLLSRRYGGVRIVHGDAYNLAETLAGIIDEPACSVVSSLPLRNRRERDRLGLLSDAFDLLHPEGAFVQFTYGIASPMPRRFGRGPDFHAEVSAPVWLNLPPARVWVYRPGAIGADHAGHDTDSQFALRLKPGRELLGEEWREQSIRLKRGFKLKAEKARAEFKSRAEKVKTGLNRTFREPGSSTERLERGIQGRPFGRR